MEERTSPSVPMEEFILFTDPSHQVPLEQPFTAELQQPATGMLYELQPSTSTSSDFEVVMQSPEFLDAQFNNLQVPYLEILVQPEKSFRFRYESELVGTHGRLHGVSQTNRRNCYPTVELKGYDGPAVIRCTLSQTDSPDEIRPHAHCLVYKSNGECTDDPHYKNVQGNNYITKWDGMGIIQTSQKHIIEKLIKKKTNLFKEKLASEERVTRNLRMHETVQIQKQAKKEAKSINLHVVYLRFDAFKMENNILIQLCRPVFSHPIRNLKSAKTNKLKITRMSTCSSPLRGGEEVFLLVEKLMKDDIKVRFFELNDTEDVIWSVDANIINVHYQTAIVIKTPPYKNQNCESQVTVFFELVRPSDGATSDPREFFYNPDPEVVMNRKRRRIDDAGPSTQSTPQFEEEDFDYGAFIDLYLNIQQDINPITAETNFSSLPEITTPIKIDSVNSFTAQTVTRNSSVITKTYNELIELIKSRPLKSQLKTSMEEHIKTTLYLAIESYGKIQDATNYVNLVLLVAKALNLESELNGAESIAHIAIKNKNYKLLERISDFYSVQDCSGNTALHLSILLNDNEACSIILSNSNGDFINLINNAGYTAVQLAVIKNNLAALTLLLENNAEILVMDKQNGNCLLHTAIENNNKEIVKYFMENIPIISTLVNYNGLSCLNLADSLGLKDIYGIINEKMETLEICDGLQPQDSLAEDILNEDLLDSLLYIRFFTPDCLQKLVTILSEDDKWHKLVELLEFSHILTTDLCKGPEEFINYALAQGTSIFDIRLNLLAMGETECVRYIDNMFTKE